MSQENDVLKKLININEDAAEFYETAIEDSDNESYKPTFKNLEQVHKSVVSNLEIMLRSNGEKYEADETLKGQFAQFWTQAMALLSDEDTKTFVYHLEEAEDRCLNSMQEAINDNGISEMTKAKLLNELTSLRKSHDYMKSLKDGLMAA